MSEVKKGRGYIYSIQYHIVWCVKYRQKILNTNIEKSLKQILLKIASDNGIGMLEMETDKDYIRLLVDCTPQQQIPSIIKALKGVAARLLFLQHPEIKKGLWGGHLWNPSYFVATVSENTEVQIRNYIDNQKVK